MDSYSLSRTFLFRIVSLPVATKDPILFPLIPNSKSGDFWNTASSSACTESTEFCSRWKVLESYILLQYMNTLEPRITVSIHPAKNYSSSSCFLLTDCEALRYGRACIESL